MKLFEYEAKNLLSKNGIPTPKGEITTNLHQSAKVARKLKPPFVIKAQVLVSGRGKAGGIRFASDVEGTKKDAEQLLRTQIKGLPVKKVLVEERIPIKKELYFAFTLDRTGRSYVAVASAKGGVDIETVASKMPAAVVRMLVDPFHGFIFSKAQEVTSKIGYRGKQQTELAEIFARLCNLGMDLDAELIEVNPLAETPNGTFVALDSRLIVDDNALFRHPEFEKLRSEKDREHTEEEIEAMKNGIAYVKLKGEVGIIGNGAGLVMATQDLVCHYGGTPANFLDLGGGASSERISTAVRIVMSDPNVTVILVNILGGLTHCDDVARAILKVRKSSKKPKPIVVRLVGTNEDEGRKILTQEGISVLQSMEETAKQAVEIAKRSY